MGLQTHDELALPTDCERHSLLCLPQLPLTKTRAIELQKLCVSIHVILPIQPQLHYTSVHLLSSWAVISYTRRHHFVCTCMCNSMVCEAMSSSHNEQTALTNWLHISKQTMWEVCWYCKFIVLYLQNRNKHLSQTSYSLTAHERNMMFGDKKVAA